MVSIQDTKWTQSNVHSIVKFEYMMINLEILRKSSFQSYNY